MVEEIEEAVSLKEDKDKIESSDSAGFENQEKDDLRQYLEPFQKKEDGAPLLAAEVNLKQ